MCERFHVEKLLRRILGDEFFAKGRFLAGDALPVGYPGDAASGFIAIQRADDGGERCGFLGVTAAHRLVGDNTLDAFFAEQGEAVADHFQRLQQGEEADRGVAGQIEIACGGVHSDRPVVCRHLMHDLDDKVAHEGIDLAGHDGRTGGHGRQTDFAEPRPGTRGQQAEIVGDLSGGTGEYLECA